jgi:hypothetical protein
MTTNLAMIPHFFETDFITSKVKVTKQLNYTFMNYIKQNLESNSLYGLCRSIIINDNKEVVCYSPPKSMTYNFFMEREMNDDVVGMEFIEGTMINVFWHGESWEFSTKSVLGGKNKFFNYPNAKTFKMMFDEACQETNLKIETLDKTKCYSFVLQHPENRIVIPHDKPHLYLIAVYCIKNTLNELGITNNVFIEHTNPIELRKWKCWENTTIKFPAIFDLSKISISTMIYEHACPNGNTPFDIVGIIFYNVKTGNRTKLRNITYEKVRQLRGNQPTLEYQYLCLRQENKVTEFLKYYPETKPYVTICRNNLHLFTKDLFTNYVSCFIKKEKKLAEYSGRYKCHMYNLHKLYTVELKSKKMYITFQIVKEYVNTLAPALLLHSLNYEHKA